LARKNCLGIHYNDKQITAVLIEQKGAEFQYVPALKVTADSELSEDQNSSLFEKLKHDLNRQYEKTPPVALTLSGHMYQSLPYQSRFSDPRLINQTLRYDIEDNLAADADSIAVCYQQKLSQSHETSRGKNQQTKSFSELLVHAISRNQLQQLLDRFEQSDLDALVAEPDIASWLNFLRSSSELPAQESLVALAWAIDSLYILILDDRHQVLLARSVPCSSGGQAHKILTSELPRSLANLPEGQQPPHLLYHLDGLDQKQIVDLARACNLQPRPISEPDLATACAKGAAWGFLNHHTAADFRSDGLFPRTLIAARHKTLYGLAAAVSSFLLVWIIVLNIHARNYRNMEKRAKTDMIAAWKLANPQRKPPRSLAQIPGSLRRRLQDVESTLMLIFRALNTLPEQFDIKITNLSADTGSAIFTGSVPDIKELEKLRKAILNPDSQLEIDSSKFGKVGSSSRDDPTNRRTFSMPLRVKKTSQ